MDPVLPIVVASIVLGAVIAIMFFGNYFNKRASEVASISKPELPSEQKKTSKPSQAVSKKSHSKSHSHGADKVTMMHPVEFWHHFIWMLSNFTIEMIW